MTITKLLLFVCFPAIGLVLCAEDQRNTLGKKDGLIESASSIHNQFNEQIVFEHEQFKKGIIEEISQWQIYGHEFKTHKIASLTLQEALDLKDEFSRLHEHNQFVHEYNFYTNVRAIATTTATVFAGGTLGLTLYIRNLLKKPRSTMQWVSHNPLRQSLCTLMGVAPILGSIALLASITAYNAHRFINEDEEKFRDAIETHDYHRKVIDRLEKRILELDPNRALLF